MLLSFDDGDTDDPAMEADSHVMAVQRPAADLFMIIDASCPPPPLGACIVRMSPLNELFYLFDRFCVENLWPKDCAIPDLA